MTAAAWRSLAWLAAAFIASVAATRWYERFALGRGIIAKINNRTLHERVVPRGGGVAFGTVFLAAAAAAAHLSGALSTRLALALVGGGAIALAVGFVDDVHEIRAIVKLGIHTFLAALLFGILYEPFIAPAVAGPPIAARVLAMLAAGFIPLWLINLFNFVDGIDGMAIVGAVFVCGAASLVLLLTNGNRDLLFAVALLGACCLGFLFFNLPPARLFMGDAGSIFLGYCVSGVVLISVTNGDMSVWTWFAILSYFIGDTTTTTLSRIVLVRSKWYGTHRSHAYQNLARVTKSHAKVTYGVAAFHVAWALPMAVWSAIAPASAPWAAVLALAPVVAWTLRFGPRLSSD